MDPARDRTDPTPPLVAAARGGDRAAFEALYRAHVGRVYAIARRLGGDLGVADDITQRTFVRAWERLSELRGPFGAWLRRIAVRMALDDVRSHRRRDARVTLSREGKVEGADPRVPGPGARLDLERAIHLLPPKARHVFVLREIEGWSHADIALALKISEGTSKAQVHRARALLRERLS